MKIINKLTAVILCLFTLQAAAQTNIPKGFEKGSITLPDGVILSGYVKDNISRDATVTFIPEKEGKRKSYDGYALNAAGIGENKFICINGDFFKVLCQGELCFLQKSSDVSGKPLYNGNEALFTGGTAGRQGDYFIYKDSNKDLIWVSQKNIDEVAAANFAGSSAAIEKAKEAKDDLARVKSAVEIYNNRNK